MLSIAAALSVSIVTLPPSSSAARANPVPNNNYVQLMLLHRFCATLSLSVHRYLLVLLCGTIYIHRRGALLACLRRLGVGLRRLGVGLRRLLLLQIIITLLLKILLN